MKWPRRKGAPPVIRIGDEVRVEAMGRTYTLRLAEVQVDYREGASATLRDSTHFMRRDNWWQA